MRGKLFTMRVPPLALRIPRRRALTWLVVALVVAAPLVASAQRGRFFGFGSRSARQANVAYDGRFTFLRAEYARYRG